jgi:hypothetical protein
MQKRTCVICGATNDQPRLQLLDKRFEIMKHWYPSACSPLDHAHKTCLWGGWSLNVNERAPTSDNRAVPHAKEAC